MEVEHLWDLLFGMLYVPHGGSSLQLTRTELLELPLDELQYYAERLEEQREEEARAIRSAAKK